jgi:hypothetical protein
MLYIHRNPKEYWLIVFNVSPAYIALLFMSTYIQFVIYKQQSFVLFVKSIPQLKSYSNKCQERDADKEEKGTYALAHMHIHGKYTEKNQRCGRGD